MSLLEDDVVKMWNKLSKSWSVGDKSMARQITEALHPKYVSRNVASLYVLVCRYITKAKHGGKPAPRAYTHNELMNMALLTDKELREFSISKRKSYETIYAAKRRFIIKDWRFPNDGGAATKSTIEDSNYFEFSNHIHLEVLGLTWDMVQSAKKLLNNKFSLTLRHPNILYHPATHKRFLLTLADQLFLISNPEGYLVACSSKIRDGWTYHLNDPIYDVVETTEYIRHRRNYASERGRALAYLNNIKPKLNELLLQLRGMAVDTKGYDLVVAIRDSFTATINTCVEFDSSNQSTYSDMSPAEKKKHDEYMARVAEELTVSNREAAEAMRREREAHAQKVLAQLEVTE